MPGVYRRIDIIHTKRSPTDHHVKIIKYVAGLGAKRTETLDEYNYTSSAAARQAVRDAVVKLEEKYPDHIIQAY